jgi:nucleotide-binding universal stress UspA family protein
LISRRLRAGGNLVMLSYAAVIMTTGVKVGCGPPEGNRSSYAAAGGKAAPARRESQGLSKVRSLDPEVAMPNPIIVGVALRDDDAAPIALAFALARLAGAPVALVTSYPYGGAPMFTSTAEVAAIREQAESRLELLAQDLGAGHEVSTHVRPEMSPALALHDAAIELDAAAIVVGSTHRGTVGRVLAGNIAAGLLHGAPCPIAVAPRGYSEPSGGFKRVGVAFVDLPEGRDALAVGAGLASATGASLTALTVMEPIQWAPALTSPGWEVPQSYQAEHEKRARAAFNAARELIPDAIAGDVELLTGAPADALARASAGLDLVICGSRGYGPVRSVMLGGVSRELSHSAACPLLLVPRPPAHDAARLWRGDAAASGA